MIDCSSFFVFFLFVQMYINGLQESVFVQLYNDVLQEFVFVQMYKVELQEFCFCLDVQG